MKNSSSTASMPNAAPVDRMRRSSVIAASSSPSAASSMRAQRHRPSSRTTDTAKPSGLCTAMYTPYAHRQQPESAPWRRHRSVTNPPNRGDRCHHRRMSTISRHPPAKTSDAQPDPRFAGLVAGARVLQPRTVALRRAVHRNPELGLRLPATQAAVLRVLDGLPLRVHSGKGLSSVVAVLDGGRPGPAIVLRGDMDALPMAERTGLPFASQVDTVMHACGHDTHVAML